MNKRFLVASLLLGALVLNLRGQQPRPAPSATQSPSAPQTAPADQDDVVRITTNLVQVDVVVTKDGKQVTNLKPEDFELFEDGKPQAITHFSYASIAPAPVAGSRTANVAPRSKNQPPDPSMPVAVREHEVRRTIAILIDDMGMSAESISTVRKQLHKFVDEQLEPNDLIAVIRTSGEVGSLQQFTTDKRLLHGALQNLRWNPCSRTGVHVFEPVGSWSGGPALCSGPHSLGATLSAFRFVLKGMHDLPGRKSLVVFSDNLPIQQQEPGPLNIAGRNGSQRSDDPTNNSYYDNAISYAALMQRVAEMAIRSSVVIYAVDTRGLQYTGLTAADHLNSGFSRGDPHQLQAITLGRSMAMFDGHAGSDLIARETGGFLIRNSNDFGLRRVMDDQRGYYLIGYRPTEDTFNRKFHHIKVRVKGPGLTVRTREGFYGVAEDEARPPVVTADDQMRKALISPFGANDITVRLTTLFASDERAGYLLRSYLYLNARDLNFTDEPDGWHRAEFDLSSILFGDNGRVIDRQDKMAMVRLQGANYDRVLRDGLVYGFDMPVNQAGAYQFRIAVRDTTTSRIGAAGQFVDVPNLRSHQLALSGIVLRTEAGAQRLLESQPLPSSPPATAAPPLAPAMPNGDDVSGGPAVRRYHQGSNVIFAYAVYNLLDDKTTHPPAATTQTRVFRDGKLIYTGELKPLDLTGQADPQRIAAAAQLQLGAELTPGEYVLQVVVADGLAKEKHRTATQWIDFEIVK
jgi:VWFA-related protein